jgi:ABC-type oligopeptide transport system ATPase subunit
MSALLTVSDLEVTYPGRGRRRPKQAIAGVSITVERGQTLGLVGESGSGKSTLGNCVLGLVRPTGGTLTFDGDDITHLSARARRAYSGQIQAVFQDPYSTFNPHRTIAQSVGETLSRTEAVSAAERRLRIINILERVGLDETALEKYPAQFSGGQRQRISIARALLPEPRLVVCDESVSALDLSVQAQVLNLLLELQREREVAYLFITHDLAVVRHMSTRIAVLEHGHLVEEGPAEKVTGQPTQVYTKRLVDASPIANPRVQEARRRTRRAMAALAHEPVASYGSASPAAVAVLEALEWQAVVEGLELREFDRPEHEASRIQSFAPPQVLASDFEGLRDALFELSSRTAPAALEPELRERLSRARSEQNAGLSPHRLAAIADVYATLIAAVRAGRDETALNLVSALHSESFDQNTTDKKEEVQR